MVKSAFPGHYGGFLLKSITKNEKSADKTVSALFSFLMLI